MNLFSDQVQVLISCSIRRPTCVSRYLAGEAQLESAEEAVDLARRLVPMLENVKMHPIVHIQKITRVVILRLQDNCR